MTCTYYNKDPLALVNNMDSYFKQIPADCSLFSEDGFELPIHKELLYQTKFMRRMLKSANMNDCKVEILCPSVTREDLETIIKFLYGGKVYCEDQSIASQVFANLKELFGFPSRNFDFDGIVLKCEMQDPSDDKVSSMSILVLLHFCKKESQFLYKKYKYKYIFGGSLRKMSTKRFV